MRRLTRSLAACLGLVAVIVLLHAAARLGLQGPTGLSGSELSEWFGDPITAVATALRWLALVLAYYLLAVVVAVLLLGERAADARFSRLIPPGLAASVGVLLGLGAVGVPLAGHMATTPAASPLADVAIDDPLRLVELDEPLELRVLADDSGAHPLTRSMGPIRTDDRATVEDTWRVMSGDSFWSIAEETLVDAWGRSDLSDGEIADYWRELIAANDARLVQRGNPDLLLPGQRLILPPPPPSS